MSKSACSGGRCRGDAGAGRRPSPAFSGALRTCSSRVANGSVGLRLRQGIDYRPEMLDGPSVMKLAYSLFGHVIQLSADGEPANTTYAGHRAAQHIRGTPIDVRGRSAVRRLGGRAVRVSWRADCVASERSAPVPDSGVSDEGNQSVVEEFVFEISGSFAMKRLAILLACMSALHGAAAQAVRESVPARSLTAPDKAYVVSVIDKIRSNVVYDDPSHGSENPRVVYRVLLLPGGEVMSVDRIRESGNSDFDMAVQNGIWKASPLPKRSDGPVEHALVIAYSLQSGRPPTALTH